MRAALLWFSAYILHGWLSRGFQAMGTEAKWKLPVVGQVEITALIWLVGDGW